MRMGKGWNVGGDGPEGQNRVRNSGSGDAGLNKRISGLRSLTGE